MVKFLHTADWHLGIKFSQLGDKADAAREIRIQTTENLLKTAKESNVDFVLISGDLFDSNDIDRTILNRVVQSMLNVAPLDIYILPGNHDPLTMDSPYLDPMWDSLSNVHIFRNPEPLIEENSSAVLYPCPITQKQSTKDFTEWIDADSSEISIGIAHGNLAIEGFTDESNFPIAPDRASDSNLDYLALGEWHSLSMFKNKEDHFKTVYPGTPETTKFGENNSGKAVIVEIDSHNAIPRISELDVGVLSWEKQVREINSISDVNNLESELKTTQNPQSKILSLNIKGVTDQETITYLSSFENLFKNQFMHFQLLMDELYLKPNLLELKALLPEGTVVNQTFEALMALMKTQPEIQDYSDISPERTREIFSQLRDKDILEGLSPEVLNRAFLLLYQMIKEVSQ